MAEPAILETDKVDVVTLLTSLKKIVVDPGQIFGDLTCLHILSIKEATDTRVLGGGKAFTNKKSRDGIKASIVETIHAGIPPSRPGKNTSIF
jgi:hypothetical protein